MITTTTTTTIYGVTIYITNFFFVIKLNLFLNRVLIFVFKRRFEVNITVIHDIWRYIYVEILLIQ